MTSTLPPVYQAVICALPVSVLLLLFGRRALQLRRRLASLSRAPPLLRIVYEPAEWRRFQWLQARKAAPGAAIVLALGGVAVLGFLWIESVAARAGVPDGPWYGDGGTLALVYGGGTLATILIFLVADHHLQWLLRRRGVVSLYRDFAILEGRLIEWSGPDDRLVEARFSPGRDLFVLELEVRWSGKMMRDVLELPVAANRRRIEGAVRELNRAAKAKRTG